MCITAAVGKEPGGLTRPGTVLGGRSPASEDKKGAAEAMERNLSGNVERETSIPNMEEQHGFDVKITHQMAKGWADYDSSCWNVISGLNKATARTWRGPQGQSCWGRGRSR